MNTTTEIDGFIAWLTAYVAEHGEAVIDDRHRYILDKAPTVEAQSTASWRVTLGGAYLWQLADSDTENALFERVVVSFNLIRLGTDRLQISAERWARDLGAYFDQLIAAIGTMWPGALATEPAEPAATELTQEDASKQPRVPGRLADFNSWRACWLKIKPLWRQGRKYWEIREWLNNMHPDLEYSEDVLAEIIKAGEYGSLDRNSPNISR